VGSGASAASGREAGSETPEWLVGDDRPDEAGELAGVGDDDLLLWLAAAGHPLPALVEPLLAAPGAFDHGGVLAALATGELVADGRPSACVPGCFDEGPAYVRVADLGDARARRQRDCARERAARRDRGAGRTPPRSPPSHVYDQARGSAPLAFTCDEHRESGRGLQIVGRLAEWSERIVAGGGKCPPSYRSPTRRRHGKGAALT
jgi:hypothetical protein